MWGDLRIQAQEFKSVGGGDKIAQILCFADVSYQHRWYEDILLLKLEVEGSQEGGWGVKETFSFLVPYMKPVYSFRIALIKGLEKFLETIPEADRRSPWSPLWMGVRQFTNSLRDFSEARELLSQVRSEVEHRQRCMKTGQEVVFEEQVQIKEMAKRLLSELGCTPKTEQRFQWKKSIS